MIFKVFMVFCTLFVLLIFNTTKAEYVRNYTYIGCYNDRKDMRDVYEKDYTRVTKLNNSYAIVEICVRLCAMGNYKFAAIQSYDECYCGNTYGRYNKTSEVNCFFKCSGYSCGGYETNSIYSTANVNNLIGGLNTGSYLGSHTRNKLPTDMSGDVNNVYYKPKNNPCDSNPCRNSGVCISILDGQGKIKSFICQCRSPEHIGLFCEQTNSCFSNPCFNGGSCISVVNGFQCVCSIGWYGDTCAYPVIPVTKQIITDDPNECTDYEKGLCKNGGACYKNSYSSMKCLCPFNYSGDYCEIFDICSLNVCKNGGHCSFTPPTNFLCNCTTKYYGSFCEFENPCYDNGPCKNGGLCRNQIIADTQNELSLKTNSSYVCLCYGNFMGKNCDSCKNGYSGEKCETIINYCQPNPCIHGFCQWQLGSYSCSCFEGWQGKNCDSPSCRSKSKPCLNGGTCSTVYNNITNAIDFACNCLPHFTGESCEINELNPCASNPCAPNENCALSIIDSSYKCVPIPNVEIINLCDIKPNICNENSVCSFDRETNGYFCKCIHFENSIDNNTKPIESLKCDYPLNYRDFFENTTTSTEQASVKDHTIVLESKSNFRLFTSNFNTENLYWIVPLGLVIVLIFVFLAIATVFGYKARNRGKLEYRNRELSSKSRSLKFYNDDLPNENQFKSISTITVPNIKCSNQIDTNNDNNLQKYLDNYGRVV